MKIGFIWHWIGTDAGLSEHDNDFSGFRTGRKFLVYLSCLWLLKMDSVPWTWLVVWLVIDVDIL